MLEVRVLMVLARISMFTLSFCVGMGISSCGNGLFAQDAALWSEPGRCGTNVLYVVLRLSDRPVNYQVVYDALATDPSRGVSLDALSRASESLGLECEVRRVTLQDFPNISTPFIAHLDMVDIGAGGHFIAVTAVKKVSSGYEVVSIDGASGHVVRQLLENLEPVFLGYVAVPTTEQLLSTAWWIRIALVAIGSLVGGGAFIGYKCANAARE